MYELQCEIHESLLRVRKKRNPKITVKVKDQGILKDYSVGIDFADNILPNVEDSFPLGGATKRFVQQFSWKRKPHMSLKDGESLIKEWEAGNVYYSTKNKRKWHKSKVKKHLLMNMKDNLEAIDLLRRYNLL